MIDKLLEYVRRVKAKQSETNTGPATGHLNRICDEVKELKVVAAKGSASEVAVEFGDVMANVLFTAHELGVLDPILCAWKSVAKVENRMEYVQNMITLTPYEDGYRKRVNELWDEAKELERYFNLQAELKARQETPSTDTGNLHRDDSLPEASCRTETTSSPTPSQAVGAVIERCYHQLSATRIVESQPRCDDVESSLRCM